MLDLRRLRLLRELHRRGTIAAVAEALSYSPSAVSQQLSTLEKDVGVPLLEPAGRRVRLTAQAGVLVEHAERLLAEMERAEAALARSLQDTVGTLRTAACQTAVLTLIPDALLRLAVEHPQLRVELTEAEPEVALPALASGQFDLVLGEEYPGHPLARPRETERQELFTDELRLVIPDGWAQSSLAALASRPFATEPPGTTAHQWCMAACRSAGFEPDGRYVSTDLQIQLRLVEAGLAAALLPDLAGATSRPGVTVRRLPGRPARQVFASVRLGALQHPTVQAFLTTLMAAHSDWTRQKNGTVMPATA